MTCRHLFENRLTSMRRIAFVGFTLYLLPLPALLVSPWFMAVSVTGLLLCTLAVVGTVVSLRCVQCNRPIIHLLTATRDRRLVAVRADVAACPYCGFDFDGHHDNSGMPEILSAYEKGNAWVGVVEVSDERQRSRYEIGLKGKSREAFQKILRSTPFKKGVPGAYRFFYVPRDRQHSRRKSSLAILRVEKGDVMQNIEFPLPSQLVNVLEFIREAHASDQIVGVNRTQSHYATADQATVAGGESTLAACRA